ncbi:hypothetical protein USB125703_00102 [Pseudoclavibacter triregionum]|nr:hypothetical protein USB125703_00102 [Pseudoclavibacter triregionum]
MIRVPVVDGPRFPERASALADSERCPWCGDAPGAGAACARCGLRLDAPEAGRAWELSHRLVRELDERVELLRPAYERGLEADRANAAIGLGAERPAMPPRFPLAPEALVDARLCPWCQSAHGGAARCGSCGLPLRVPEVAAAAELSGRIRAGLEERARLLRAALPAAASGSAPKPAPGSGPAETPATPGGPATAVANDPHALPTRFGAPEQLPSAPFSIGPSFPGPSAAAPSQASPGPSPTPHHAGSAAPALAPFPDAAPGFGRVPRPQLPPVPAPPHGTHGAPMPREGAPARPGAPGSRAPHGEPSDRPRRSPIQVTLLATGIGLLSIAAIVFLTIAWLMFDLWARAAVTAGITAAAVGASIWLSRRSGLRATAEGVAVFGTVLLLLDVWAVRELDLFGAGSLDAALYWGIGLSLVAAIHLGWRALAPIREPILAASFLLPPAAGFLATGLAGQGQDSIPAYTWAVGAGLAGLLHPVLARLAPSPRADDRAAAPAQHGPSTPAAHPPPPAAALAPRGRLGVEASLIAWIAVAALLAAGPLGWLEHLMSSERHDAAFGLLAAARALVGAAAAIGLVVQLRGRGMPTARVLAGISAGALLTLPAGTLASGFLAEAHPRDAAVLATALVLAFLGEAVSRRVPEADRSPARAGAIALAVHPALLAGLALLFLGGVTILNGLTPLLGGVRPEWLADPSFAGPALAAGAGLGWGASHLIAGRRTLVETLGSLLLVLGAAASALRFEALLLAVAGLAVVAALAAAGRLVLVLRGRREHQGPSGATLAPAAAGLGLGAILTTVVLLFAGAHHASAFPIALVVGTAVVASFAAGSSRTIRATALAAATGVLALGLAALAGLIDRDAPELGASAPGPMPALAAACGIALLALALIPRRLRSATDELAVGSVVAAPSLLPVLGGLGFGLGGGSEAGPCVAAACAAVRPDADLPAFLCLALLAAGAAALALRGVSALARRAAEATAVLAAAAALAALVTGPVAAWLSGPATVSSGSAAAVAIGAGSAALLGAAVALAIRLARPAPLVERTDPAPAPARPRAEKPTPAVPVPVVPHPAAMAAPHPHAGPAVAGNGPSAYGVAPHAFGAGAFGHPPVGPQPHGHLAYGAQPIGQQAHAQPPFGHPAVGHTGFGQTAFRPPAFGQPGYGQPALGQPGFGQPAFGHPALGQPTAGPSMPPRPAPDAEADLAPTAATLRASSLADGLVRDLAVCGLALIALIAGFLAGQAIGSLGLLAAAAALALGAFDRTALRGREGESSWAAVRRMAGAGSLLLGPLGWIVAISAWAPDGAVETRTLPAAAMLVLGAVCLASLGWAREDGRIPAATSLVALALALGLLPVAASAAADGEPLRWLPWALALAAAVVGLAAARAWRPGPRRWFGAAAEITAASVLGLGCLIMAGVRVDRMDWLESLWPFGAAVVLGFAALLASRAVASELELGLARGLVIGTTAVALGGALIIVIRWGLRGVIDGPSWAMSAVAAAGLLIAMVPHAIAGRRDPARTRPVVTRQLGLGLALLAVVAAFGLTLPLGFASEPGELAWHGLFGWLRTEALSWPLAAGFLAGGAAALATRPGTRSWPELGPGLALLLFPSILAGLADADGVRLAVVGALCVATLLVGALMKLQAPLALGAIATALHAILTFWPLIADVYQAVPWWIWLAIAGAILVVIAATYEARLRDAKRVVRSFSELR